MTEKRDRFEQVLKHSFSIENFVTFTRELLTDEELIAPNKYNIEYSNISYYIAGYTHIANYSGKDSKKIAIFAVELNKKEGVERARSMQRNFAKRLIENGGCDGALVAFYTVGEAKWRLSFVRMDYEFAKGKVNIELTPAKRYSYLVGEGEPCHTAMSRLFPIFENDDTNPSIDDLEDAFSVERVTKEFFEQYCEKYQQVREWLEKSAEFLEEANRHNFTSEQFAKKLMGQIVFLYFVQKKGWLGVKAIPDFLNGKEYRDAFFARGSKSKELIPKLYIQIEEDKYQLSKRGLVSLSPEDDEIMANCVKGAAWGTGPKNFMRKLFDSCVNNNKNLFNDYLEPLFYFALNTNRGDNGYFPLLHCRIPFLNGGLFEQLDNYEWQHNYFGIPNELFSNKKGENDREADGILDIFDRYNFTMNEDEPMEKEVAIDPEMLGKIFENLLDIKDRKSKGAFYTPREVVHYMCQESLTNYLVNATGLPYVDVKDFILYGEIMKDEDTVKEVRDGNGGMFISPCIFDINSGVNRLKDIDDALANIRIADPAVGSGAFPLGMLNEIIRARQNITAYLAITMNAFQRKEMYSFYRHPYTLKTHTIKNSIFAVDIEPSAVDIAKLRLWLSLVIEDEINPDATDERDGHSKPRALPNLDCNIVCGNSLIDRLDGYKLINESVLLGNSLKQQQPDIYLQRFDELTKELISAQKSLFVIKDHAEKEELKRHIQILIDQIVSNQLQTAPDLVKEKYRQTTYSSSLPYILWQLVFARVFREKGGFDVVIGNPPYIQLQTMHEKADELINMKYRTFAKTGDIYCLFYEIGYKLLHERGILSFITSNKWMKAGYGSALRGFFSEFTNPLLLIDFTGQKIFESATVDVNILVFEKCKNAEKTKVVLAKADCLKNLSNFVERNSAITSFRTTESWVILSTKEAVIKQKMVSKGVKLSDWNIKINYGIKTGCNEAFIIDTETKERLIAEDPKSEELIHPVLRGRDINRYEYDFSELYIISTFPSLHYDIECYPAIKQYLLSFGLERIEQTGKKYIINGEEINARKKTNNQWFETQDAISYWEDFNKQKIVWGNLSLAARYTVAEAGIFINAPSPILVPADRYILGVLNSKLADWYIQNLGVTRNGGYFEYKPMFVEKLPIVQLSDTDNRHLEIIQLVESILTNKKQLDTCIQESRIDELVYDIYGLDKEEQNYIDAQ